MSWLSDATDQALESGKQAVIRNAQNALTQISGQPTQVQAPNIPAPNSGNSPMAPSTPSADNTAGGGPTGNHWLWIIGAVLVLFLVVRFMRGR